MSPIETRLHSPNMTTTGSGGSSDDMSLTSVTVAVVGYLAVLAAWPTIRDHLPAALVVVRPTQLVVVHRYFTRAWCWH